MSAARLARRAKRRAAPKTPYVYTQARPVKEKTDPRYWSTQARSARQLFPSDLLAVPKGGNTVESSNKLVLRTAPHLGKRDIFEYMTKIYGVKVLRVNSLNFPGKLKRSVKSRGQHIYRTKAFKKFYVTLDTKSSLRPEDEINAVFDAEIVGSKI